MSSSGRDVAVEQIVLGIGQEVFNAIRRKDVNSLGRFLAKDFAHRTPDGSKVGKEQFLRNIADAVYEVRLEPETVMPFVPASERQSFASYYATPIDLRS